MRCFEDSGDVQCDPKLNVFVGKNNAGKSTVLKAILGLQGFPFSYLDVRPGYLNNAFISCHLNEIIQNDIFNIGRQPDLKSMRCTTVFQGVFPNYGDALHFQIAAGQPLFPSTRPQHTIVPFIAKRKAVAFNHDISLGKQSEINGTLSLLYSRIDLLATKGHPDHDRFNQAVLDIIGIPITTKASNNGKEAGFYFDRKNFVTLENMGDGVTEMVALIVELCTEENKIFVLEEPETNLHPKGLKALLGMVRVASETNQFFIATHSNVVIRELSNADYGKIFRVYRDGELHTSPSKVEEVEKSPQAHLELLRELGYEFADLELHDGWLFLEESSAERIMRDILVPMFAPKLRGRLRTFSSGGVDALEPSVADFQRLMVFIHLQPVYKDRLWVRADGDSPGIETVKKMRSAFPHLKDDSLDTFKKEQFEYFYPSQFQEEVKAIVGIDDKHSKRKQKLALLKAVLEWTQANPTEAKIAWAESAEEPLKLLQAIEAKLTT